MIRLNEYILYAFLMFLCTSGLSQEYSIYQDYYLSPFIINPAVSGSELYTVADLSFKQQWLGFSNAPTTYKISGHFRFGKYDFYDPKGFLNKGPLKLTDRIGVGAAIYNDNNGPSGLTGGLISYAYHVPVSQEANLSFGMALVGSYYTFNSALLNPDQPDDYYLLNGNDNKFKLNVNVGGYYYSYRYFIGLSADKILRDISQVNEDATMNPSYFLIGGYKFMAASNSFNVEPSIAIKKVGTENISADIHAKLYIKHYNWIAVSYGTSGILNFRFGLRLYKMLYVGYNYGYTISEIAAYNYGSHEIHLGINLGLVGVKGVRETINK